MATARVLVVDDEPLFLGVVARTLTRSGYDVLQASEPRQALEIVRCDPPIDVVLSDVQMPQMLGTDLVREVAQLSPETACVLMTGGVVDPSALPLEVSANLFYEKTCLPQSSKPSRSLSN